MLDCVRMATACLVTYYGDLYRELEPVLRVPAEPTPLHGVTDGDEADRERQRLTLRAVEAMSKLGVKPDNPLLRSFVCPD